MANYENFAWKNHRDGPNDLDLLIDDRFNCEYEKFEYWDEEEGTWVDNRPAAMKELHEVLEKLAHQRDLQMDALDAARTDEIEYCPKECWENEEQTNENIQPSSQPEPPPEPPPEPFFHEPIFEIN